MLLKLIKNIKPRSLVGRAFILAFGLVMLVLILSPNQNSPRTPDISRPTENNYVTTSLDLTNSTSSEISQLVNKSELNQNQGNHDQENETSLPPVNEENLYLVTKVVDGDTIDVTNAGQTERVRLIGINTPETVDPRRSVECFGVEASNRAKAILTNQQVSLVGDASQADRDKYGRWLRYVFLADGTNVNWLMIREGYAYEYTYNLPYKYQASFKQAEQEARVEGLGLWAEGCDSASNHRSTPMKTVTVTDSDVKTCLIKGNINSNGEKIYHIPGCDYYTKTKISLERGEQWFCSESDAVTAGWRKALNCR